jgi:hypothetical protein
MCERCKVSEAKCGEKYCKVCRKLVLAEMAESGYLQKTSWGHGTGRAAEAKENTYETKHGSGHG